MKRTVAPWTAPPRCTIRVPGDKSIAHRRVLFAAVADGPCTVKGLPDGADVRASVGLVAALGVSVESVAGGIRLSPPSVLRSPAGLVQCGNSGTTMRIGAALAAHVEGPLSLDGDESLRRRPMGRVLEPLARFGIGHDGARVPLRLTGPARHRAVVDLALPSAQLRSAVWLAGLRVGVELNSPPGARDHTERLLLDAGADLDLEGLRGVLRPSCLAPWAMKVPRDPSSACFWWVAAAITPGAVVHTPDVSLNPFRTGALDVLRSMGAHVEVADGQGLGREPMGHVTVTGPGALVGAHVDGTLALRCLDEIPALAIAMAFAGSPSELRDLAELRVKESDRLAALEELLSGAGIEVEARLDGMSIFGGGPRRAVEIDAGHDHRIAMAAAVLGGGGRGAVVGGAESVASSYPTFWRHLSRWSAAPR